jgi:hypothetical protein
MVTDVQASTIEVSDGDRTFSVHRTSFGHDADAGSDPIEGLRQHIERLAGTEAWLNTCARTEDGRTSSNRVLDTR